MSDVRSPTTRTSGSSSSSSCDFVVIASTMLSFAPLLGLLSIALTLGTHGAAARQSMRVATYNLRYDSKPDNITVNETLAALPDPLTAPKYFELKGEQPWSTRRVKVYQHLNSEGIVLAGALS